MAKRCPKCEKFYVNEHKCTPIFTQAKQSKTDHSAPKVRCFKCNTMFRANKGRQNISMFICDLCSAQTE